MFYFVLNNHQAVEITQNPSCPPLTLLYTDKEKARNLAFDRLAEGVDVLLISAELADLANAQFLNTNGVEIPVEDALSANSFMIAESVPLNNPKIQQVLEN